MDRGLQSLEYYMEVVGKHLSLEDRLIGVDILPSYVNGLSVTFITNNLYDISSFIADKDLIDIDNVKRDILNFINQYEIDKFDLEFIYKISLGELSLINSGCFKTFDYVFTKFNYCLDTDMDVVDAWLSLDRCCYEEMIL